MFWKLLPLIIEVVKHAGNIIVERYRAQRRKEERKDDKKEGNK